MFRVLLSLLMLLCAAAASAADNGIYIGGGITQTNVQIDDVNLDDDDNGFKAIVGLRPLDWLAIEANYVDFGAVTVGDPATLEAEFDAKGIDAFVVGLYEVAIVDFFAKVGLVSWDADLTLRDTGGVIDRASDSGTDFGYGAGIQAHFGSLSARAEYERFEIEDTDSFDVISLSVTWTFL